MDHVSLDPYEERLLLAAHWMPFGDDLDTLLARGCWAVPLLLAEPLIQLRSMLRPKGTTARQAISAG